jgi:hypothetical protein
MLNDEVRRLLAEQDVSEQVLADMPFTVASTHEFEAAIQVIAQIGIDHVMAKKTRNEQRNWLLLPFLRENFSTEMKHVNWTLFASEWGQLI